MTKDIRLYGVGSAFFRAGVDRPPAHGGWSGTSGAERSLDSIGRLAVLRYGAPDLMVMFSRVMSSQDTVFVQDERRPNKALKEQRQAVQEFATQRKITTRIAWGRSCHFYQNL